MNEQQNIIFSIFVQTLYFNMKISHILFFAFCLIMSACGNQTSQTNTNEVKRESYTKVSPGFNADSAYMFIEKQVTFGPRVPNTSQHIVCGNYLVEQLKSFGAEVIEQKADLKAYDGTILKARNIIASFDKENKDRILLFAHWDTRPFADQDASEKNHRTPIDGANDGASGVGVLLEIARNIQSKKPNLGIDIIFFDAEDYGVPEFDRGLFSSSDDTWCLGSQHWSKNPHTPNYKARFGILLDMVGAHDATFLKEYFSKQYAAGTVEKVWRTARNLGHGKYFVDRDGGAITDDHLPVNKNLKIPSIDIIQFDPNTPNGFGDYWHTVNDNMSMISKETLKAVGETVLEVIYLEK